MNTESESLLRNNLKVALEHTKKLFDDGLLDEKEFKDLKAHELSKYKEQLAAVTASAISRTIDDASPLVDSINANDEHTPIRTPLNSRTKHLSVQSPISAPSYSSPPTVQRKKRGKEELLYVDSNTYKRLTTPPIFRRRSAKKRKIVIPSAELQALQRLHDENARSI